MTMVSLTALTLLSILISPITFSKESQFPSLLSLNCTQSFPNPLSINKTVQVLLDYLTSNVTKTRFITSIIDLGPDRLIGRSYLNQTACTACAQMAKQTISILCPSANALNRTSIMNRVWFEPALELQCSNASKIQVFAECVHSVPTEDQCEVWVGKGIEKLYEYCGGNYQFFSHVEARGGVDSGNGSGESGNDGGLGFKGKVALIWGVVFTCFVVFVLCAWLLRRSIVNAAKVATFGG